MPKSSRPDIPDAGSEADTPLTAKQRYYRANREVIKAKSRKWQEQNAERRKKYLEEYHLKNRDRIIEKSRKWVEDNKERRKAYIKRWTELNADKNRSYQQKYRFNLRMMALEHYSKGKNECACCGESFMEFLSIDHINGEGNKHRKSINLRGGHHFYAWLRRNGYPEGYRVLCLNCNQSLGVFGYCPHNPN